MLRKLSTLVGIAVVGVATGMIGQSLVADAGSPNASTRSDKTIYAKSNSSFQASTTHHSSTAETVLKITVGAPASGQAAVHIDSQLWTDFPATGPGQELESLLSVGRCSDPDTIVPSRCANETTSYFHKPENETAADSTYPFSMEAQLGFRAAGEKTLYLNVSSSAYNAGLWSGAHVQVAFTPKRPISDRSRVTVAVQAPGLR